MNTVCRDIFRAIHENKWLSIEYKNKQEGITKYWIGIMDVNPMKRSLCVEGLHLGQLSTIGLNIYIDSILSSNVIEGSYFDVKESLKEDIQLNQQKYISLFHNVSNLKILSYYIDCNKMDSVPYKTEYSLIRHFDGDCIRRGDYHLAPDQFQEIVSNFQYGCTSNTKNNRIWQLALNLFSVASKQGLYVLAYREMKLDVARRCLRPADEVTICTEFTIDGTSQSIRRFLDADDYELLNDFEKNQETIKNRITECNSQIKGVDDMPYLIAIGRDIMLDLHEEYKAIDEMFQQEEVTAPIRAFFGNLVQEPASRKVYPIAMLNKQIKQEQLLAIHNAMKYPLAYIQGPPGTGKTNTIVNTLVTAFFNEQTVLFVSYNNHPIDGVCEKLQHISNGKKGNIPFPIIRLGNDDKVAEALEYIQRLYESTKSINIYEETLKKRKSDRIARTRQLTALLHEYEERLKLFETKEAILSLMESNKHLTFQTQLQGIQLAQVEDKISKSKDYTDEEALNLILEDEDAFKSYLYYTSAKCIKPIQEPKNAVLLDIVTMYDKE